MLSSVLKVCILPGNKLILSIGNKVQILSYLGFHFTCHFSDLSYFSQQKVPITPLGVLGKSRRWVIGVWTVYPPESKGMCLLIPYCMCKTPDNCCHGYSATHWLHFSEYFLPTVLVASGQLLLLLFMHENKEQTALCCYVKYVSNISTTLKKTF